MNIGRGARAFGGVHVETISGGNKIATFPTNKHGAAAQFYLLSTSKYYKDKSIAEAINTWSGGNHVNAYLTLIETRTGFSRHDRLDDRFLTNKKNMVKLAQAMAFHEAGREFPMSYDDWEDAFIMSRAKITGGSVDVPTTASPPVTAPMQLAMTHLGEEEIKGSMDNEFINGCFDEIGLPHLVDDDPWCAAFLGAMLKRSNCAWNHKRADARSYLDYGIKLDEPEIGAIVIMWRESPQSWKGHVGFVTDYTDTMVTILGGNQNDSVSYMTVPRRGATSQILGYRRPISLKAPVTDVVGSDDFKYKATGLLATLGAMAWSVGEGFAEAAAIGYAYLRGLLSDAPDLASDVEKQIESTKRLSELMDLPWPIYLSLAIVALAIIGNLSKTWKRMRNRQDPQTDVTVRAG